MDYPVNDGKIQRPVHTTLKKESSSWIKDLKAQAVFFRKETISLWPKEEAPPRSILKKDLVGGLQAVWTAVSLQMLALSRSISAFGPASCCSWGGCQPKTEQSGNSSHFHPMRDFLDGQSLLWSSHQAGRDFVKSALWSDSPSPNPAFSLFFFLRCYAPMNLLHT